MTTCARQTTSFLDVRGFNSIHGLDERDTFAVDFFDGEIWRGAKESGRPSIALSKRHDLIMLFEVVESRCLRGSPRRQRESTTSNDILRA